MLLKHLTIAAAGLAATTQAFLLPPEVSESDIELINTLPVEAPVIAEKQVLKLDCPNCPPLFKFHHGVAKVRNGPSHLELEFTIDHEHNTDRLLVNGFELFPNSDPFNNVLTAAQVPDCPEAAKKHRKEHKDKEAKELKSHHKWRPHNKPQIIEQALGFSLAVRPMATETQSENDQFELISVDLQIIEVGNSFVDDIPNIHINLLRGPSEKLMIGNVDTTKSQSPSDSADKQEECTTFICKWRAMLADHMKGKKHCGGMKGHQGAPMYRHRHHTHSWSRLFSKLTHHIILPVLVGIIAGVSVSVIGMIIGTLVVGLWRKFVRGQTFFAHRHCRHARRTQHKAAHKEAVVEEEKSGLIEHQDPPPSYEDEEAKAEA